MLPKFTLEYPTTQLYRIGSLGIAVVGCISGGVLRTLHAKHPHIFLVVTENPREPPNMQLKPRSYSCLCLTTLLEWERQFNKNWGEIRLYKTGHRRGKPEAKASGETLR